MKRLCIDCNTQPRMARNERCELCNTVYLASFTNTLQRPAQQSRPHTASTSQQPAMNKYALSLILAPHSFSEREKALFDEAYQRGVALDRSFLEREVMQAA